MSIRLATTMTLPKKKAAEAAGIYGCNMDGGFSFYPKDGLKRDF